MHFQIVLILEGETVHLELTREWIKGTETVVLLNETDMTVMSRDSLGYLHSVST
jgi:hypothetical protein